MNIFRAKFAVAGTLILLCGYVEAYSKAAEWLIAQEVEAGCGAGVKGRFSSGAVIERDLTGDGRKDLIISHEGLSCDSRAESLACGQLCSWMIYVREGDLLVEKEHMLGRGVRLGSGEPPAIEFHGKSHRGTLKWNGKTFSAQ